jgi:type II secretory pathway component PulC
VILRVGQATADELGVAPGDVIVAINQARIASAEDAARALDYYGGRGVIRMILERAGTLYSTEFIIR